MAPDTIVLVHGFWVTPRSWEHWITHYEARGFRVIAPGYPGFEVEVEALTEGVRVVPLSQVKSTFPALKSPANRHKVVPLSFEEWNYAFTNTFSEPEARALYERYAIPANGGSRATRTPGSITTTTSGRRCCSSPAQKTTSCRRRSRSRTPSTTSRQP